MSSDCDLTELFNELSLAHGCDLDAIKDVLEQQGIIDPSKSLIKKLLANIESKRCCRCHYVAADQNELVTHLKKKVISMVRVISPKIRENSSIV